MTRILLFGILHSRSRVHASSGFRIRGASLFGTSGQDLRSATDVLRRGLDVALRTSACDGLSGSSTGARLNRLGVQGSGFRDQEPARKLPKPLNLKRGLPHAV